MLTLDPGDSGDWRFSSDLIPMNPEIGLKCQCGLISLDSTAKDASFIPIKVEVVKLIPKAYSKSTFSNKIIVKLNNF